MVLTKVAHNDAKSLKKIGCIFPHHLGGGGVRPWCGKFHKIFIFLTLYPSLRGKKEKSGAGYGVKLTSDITKLESVQVNLIIINHQQHL